LGDSGNAVVAMSKNLAAFSNALNEGLPQRLEELVTTLLLPLADSDADAPPTSDAFKAALSATTKTALESIARWVTDAAEVLSQADINEHRDSIKAQQNVHMLKMEASRTAAQVQVKNCVAEQEAAQMKALQKQAQVHNKARPTLRWPHRPTPWPLPPVNASKRHCKLLACSAVNSWMLAACSSLACAGVDDWRRRGASQCDSDAQRVSSAAREVGAA
jgi:hypothetical protein